MIKNRKIYIIDPRLQYSMMFQVMLLCVFSISVFLFAFFVITAQHMAYLTGSTDLIQNFYDFMEYTWNNYSIFILLITLAAMYITGALALLMTHQIAGPVYRFLDILEKIKQRDISEHFRLRKNDHLKNMEEKIQILLEDMNNTTLKQRDIIHQLKEIFIAEKMGKKINDKLKFQLLELLQAENYSYILKKDKEETKN